MSEPSSVCFADAVWQGSVAIESNEPIARDTYRVRMRCPEIARRIVPGQFVMMRLSGLNDPLLARPLALYDTFLDDATLDNSGTPVGIDVVYLIVGKMTGRLAELRPGRRLDLWGPLGNGFAPHTSGRLVMVAGGIGQTPFMALAREALAERTYGDRRLAASLATRVASDAAKQPLLLYGARTKAYLAGVDDFERLGVEVRVSTDDGTAGHHGFVTDLLREQLRAAEGRESLRVVCCGPEPMMHAVAKMTAEAGVRCEVSLETPMACGVGICFTCVAKVRQTDGHWDYRRTCVEGPIFDAAQIVFD